MAKPGHHIAGLVRFALLQLCLYFTLQAAIVILHEYTHSTTAWLLGYTPTFNTVVWGNPFTILGWDEGVPYNRLFPGPGHPAEAAIGGMPLLIHALLAGLSLAWLLKDSPRKSSSLFWIIYWFAVVNLTELVAYIAMRPFAGSGDTGRFNRGLNLPPELLFLLGNLLLIAALVLFRRAANSLMSRLDHDRRKLRMVQGFTAFMMFLGGSGLRIMALYPDRQWKWGLIGIPLFFLWILYPQRAPAHPRSTGAPTYQQP